MGFGVKSAPYKGVILMKNVLMLLSILLVAVSLLARPVYHRSGGGIHIVRTYIKKNGRVIYQHTARNPRPHWQNSPEKP